MVRFFQRSLFMTNADSDMSARILSYRPERITCEPQFGRCHNREGEYGARNYLYSISSGPEREVLEMPLRLRDMPLQNIDEVLADETSMVSYAAYCALTDSPLFTVEEDADPPRGHTMTDAIIEVVAEEEHTGHAVGQRMSRRAGQHMAKIMFVKLVFLLEILAIVPTGTAMIQSQPCDWYEGVCRPTVNTHCELSNGSCALALDDISTHDCYFLGGECVAYPILTTVQKFECGVNKAACQLQPVEKGLTLFCNKASILSKLAAEEARIVSLSLLMATAGILESIFFAILVLVFRFIEKEIDYTGWLILDAVQWFKSGSTQSVVLDETAYNPWLYAFYGLLNAYLLKVIAQLLIRIYSGITLLVRDRIFAWRKYIGTIKVRTPEFKKLLTFGFGNGIPIPEMAITGSTFRDTIVNSGVVSVLAKVDGDLLHVGFAFRVRDYLITANHVVREALTRSNQLYLCPFKAAGSYSEINVGKLKEFDVGDGDEKNIVNTHDVEQLDLAVMYDVYVQRMPKDYFTGIGVTSLAPSNACLQSVVKSSAVHGDRLKQASGYVIELVDGMRVRYSASTESGSSGCPIVTGSKKFVALHQSTDGKTHNEGVHSSLVEMFIRLDGRKEEATGDVYHDEKRGVFRDSKGRQLEVLEHAFGIELVDRRTGRRRALARSEIHDFEEISRRCIEDGYGHRFEESNTDGLSVQTTPARDSSPYVEYDDEVNRKEAPPLAKPVSPKKTVDVDLSQTALEISDDVRTPIFAPRFKGYSSKTSAVIDFDEAKRLGYDADKYDFPSGDPNNSTATSLFKHAEVHKDACVNYVDPPAEVKAVAKRASMTLCKFNKYEMISDPLSDENIGKILNSSLIKDSKSPGRHFIVDGKKTNAEVIAAYSVEEFAELVRSVAKGGTRDINVFIKLEPTKKAKLSSGMPRIISGVDIIETVLAHAYFSNFNEALAKNYKRSPAAVGFSPLKQKDADEFFRDLEKYDKIVCDDVSTLDWRYTPKAVEDLCDIVVGLAVRPRGMTEEESSQWRVEAKEVFMRQFLMPFVLPDGRVIKRLKPCIMASGSVLTLAVNTLAMVYFDSLAKLEMGYTVDDICGKKFKLRAGGDDKTQGTPSDFDEVAYKEKLEAYGLAIHDVHVTTPKEGFEFFSWTFVKDVRGEVTWTPTRFTKHVQNLRVVDYANLPDALISHMYNWAHSKDHFEFFRSIYESCPAEDGFNVLDLPDRLEIINHLHGFESASSGKIAAQLRALLLD